MISVTFHSVTITRSPRRYNGVSGPSPKTLARNLPPLYSGLQIRFHKYFEICVEFLSWGDHSPNQDAWGSGPSPKTLAMKLYTFVLIWFHNYFMNLCWISSMRWPLPQSRCEGEWSLKKRWLGNKPVKHRSSCRWNSTQISKYFWNRICNPVYKGGSFLASVLGEGPLTPL